MKQCIYKNYFLVIKINHTLQDLPASLFQTGFQAVEHCCAYEEVGERAYHQG